MRRLIPAALVFVTLSAASSAVDARQGSMPNVPGMPTQAQTVIINPPSQPVPVVLASGGEVQPVTLIGTPSVVLAPGGAVVAQAGRQAWEYRAISVSSGQDPTSMLNVAGVEGWEAVGMIPGGAGTIQVVLKRPR
jgi:hypothetical protein